MLSPQIAKDQTCFIVLPGLSPDTLSILPYKHHFESLGYAAIATNFWGTDSPVNLSRLTVDACLANINNVIDEAKRRYQYVVGVGISLGGALFIEHAKTHTTLDYVASIGTPFKMKKKALISACISLGPILHPVWKAISKSQRLRPLPVTAASMALDFFGGRFQEHLESITTPILFLHSKEDPVTDYRALSAYQTKIPNAPTRVALSNSGGHEMNYDPILISGDILRFLNQQPFKKAGLAETPGTQSEPLAQNSAEEAGIGEPELQS